jgi:hypothetical protein
MRRWLWVSLLGWWGCAPHAPPVAVKAPNAPVDQNAETVKFCAGVIAENDVPRCIREVQPEQQRHRTRTERLLLRGGRVIRQDVISGSGAPLWAHDSFVYDYEGERVTGWSVESANGVLRGRSIVSRADRSWLRFVDEQDRPTTNQQSHASGMRRRFDARGRVSAYAWVNHLGEPVAEGSIHEFRQTTDESGQLLAEAAFGLQGEPAADADGVHRVAHVPDGRGRDSEIRYFGLSGQPVLLQGGHLWRMGSDSNGNALTLAAFDGQGRPAIDSRLGAAAQRIRRDERGNEVGLELLDEHGTLTTGKDGYAKVEQRFDELDRLLERHFFDASGAPVRDATTGAASQRLVRDARGNVVSTWLFDEHGAPTLGVEGYQRMESSYDARDQLVLSSYFDANGVRTTLKDGYSAVRRSYDGSRLIRVEYLGTADRPTSIVKGYASYEIRYAADGSPEAPRRFDLKGLLQLKCDGEVTPQLQKELSERAASSKSCYDRLLRYGEAGEGRLMVELKIDERGEVVAGQLVQDDIGDTALADCLLGVLREPYENKPSGGECAAVRIPLAFVQKR